MVTTRSPSPCDVGHGGRQPVERRDHDDSRAAGTCDRRGQRFDCHPWDRRLPGRVDVGQHHSSAAGERSTELAHQLLRAGVAVRLEHHDDPAG